jgi:hypothetical protein
VIKNKEVERKRICKEVSGIVQRVVCSREDERQNSSQADWPKGRKKLGGNL